MRISINFFLERVQDVLHRKVNVDEAYKNFQHHVMVLLRARINDFQHVTIYELFRVFYDSLNRFAVEVRVLNANCVTNQIQDIEI